MKESVSENQPAPSSISASPGTSAGSTLGALLRRSDTSVLLATLLLFILFAFSNSSFLTPFNLFNVARTASLYVFVALGQAIVIVIGGMNLSLGAIGGLTVVIAGWTMDTMGWSPWIGVPLALLAGTAAGCSQRLYHHQVEAELLHRHARHLVYLYRPGAGHLARAFPTATFPRTSPGSAVTISLAFPTCLS